MNKKNTRRALLGGFALALACSMAFVPEAQAHDGAARHGKEGKRAKGDKKAFKKMSPEAFVQRFDKNRDGILEMKELPELLQKRLAAADTNRDGKLSVEELHAFRAAFKGGGKKFERLDKNGDGVLTKDEVGEHKWERIAKADANKDGKVTKDELEAAWARKREAKRQSR